MSGIDQSVVVAVADGSFQRPFRTLEAAMRAAPATIYTIELAPDQGEAPEGYAMSTTSVEHPPERP